MFNDRKHTLRYARRTLPLDARKRISERRLTLEAWLEMALIVLVAIFTYIILAGPG